MDHGDFSYGPHALQKARVFSYTESNKQTLLFIHGGAWRDPNNTYDDFADLAQMLHVHPKFGATNMVSVNYRLSPEVSHPQHLQDVVDCIRHIAPQCGRLSIVGHSVGATLMMQLLNWREFCTGDEIGVTFGDFYFVDGIYDIKDLVSEYEDYRDFVEMAFSGAAGATGSDWSEASPISWTKTDPQGRLKKFDVVPEKMVVVYSEQDELLSARQGERFVAYLRDHSYIVDYVHGQWGRHDEVYRRRELAAAMGDPAYSGSAHRRG